MSQHSLIFCLGKVKMALYFLLLGCVMAFGRLLFAQSPPFAEGPSSSEIISGRPFSAVRFTRKVHIGRDGTSVIVAERRDALLARDVNGQVFMADGAKSPNKPCDLPNLGKLPLCEIWRIIIFDPNAGIMWHWLDGTRADATQYIEVNLLGDQIAIAKRFTSALPDLHVAESEPGVSMRDLGQQNIEGIPARGIRTTTLNSDATGVPKVTIHEVWTSSPMNLVLLVVDGDPAGDETVSGLDHVSLTPSPIFFQVPTDRVLRHWKDQSEFADDDITQLAGWLIR